MVTIGEATKMQKIYTTERLLCPLCNKNSNFLYVVKKDGDKYYLGEKCSNNNCQHYADFKNIPARLAQDYPAPQK